MGVVMIFCWCLPVLNYWDAWDDYLSFSLYSGKRIDMYVRVYDEDLSLLNDSLQDYLVRTRFDEQYVVIDIFDWALSELQVPVYPERRVLQQVADYFCSYIPQERLLMYDYERPLSIASLENFSHQYTCANPL